MLDTTLFNVNLPTISNSNRKALILSSCRVVLSEDVAYSEFDELNYYSLNNNDYGCGRVDIELGFKNEFNDPYFKFFVQCVAIRTDNEVLCKINYNIASKAVKHYSKITKEGKLAIGIGYYFNTNEQKALLMNCQKFCIEGNIALKKKTNVYGFMCRVEQTQSGWQLSEGNTYQNNKHINIRSLYH